MKVLLELFRALSFAVVFFAVIKFLTDWYTTLWGRYVGYLLTLVFVVGGVGYAHAYLVRKGATCCDQCGISLIDGYAGYCAYCWKTVIRSNRGDTEEEKGDDGGAEQAITEEMIDKYLGKEKKYVAGIRVDDPADD